MLNTLFALIFSFIIQKFNTIKHLIKKISSSSGNKIFLAFADKRFSIFHLYCTFISIIFMLPASPAVFIFYTIALCASSSAHGSKIQWRKLIALSFNFSLKCSTYRPDQKMFSSISDEIDISFIYVNKNYNTIKILQALRLLN